jgi:predicted PurR-regulated permease PerM
MEIKKKDFNKIIVIVTYSILLFGIVMNFQKSLEVLGWFLKLILPFIVGFSLAFLINVIMVPIEKRLKTIFKNYAYISERVIALIISLSLIIFAISFLLFLVVPEFKNTIGMVSQRLPEMAKKIDTWQGNYIANIPFQLPDIQMNWNNVTEWLQSFVGKGGSAIFATTVDISSSILNVFFNIIIGFVFSIYLLLQKEKLTRQVRDLLFRFISEAKVNRIIKLGYQSQEIFSNFIRGQFLEALIIGILSFIGMLLLNLPYPLVISALVGFTAIIPVFGALIGTSIGVFLILMVDPIKALWFLIFLLVLQQIEGNVIYPKVVGKSIGLPSIWVFAAVTIGASAFGVLGMLIGVPLFSLFYSILREKVYNY